MKSFLSYTPVLWWLLSFDVAIAITAGNRFDGAQRITISTATGLIALAAAIALLVKATDWVAHHATRSGDPAQWPQASRGQTTINTPQPTTASELPEGHTA